MTRHFCRFLLLPTPLFTSHSSSALVVVSTLNIYITSQWWLTSFAVYTNSLLATLNARKILAGDSEPQSVDAMSVSLRDLPKKSQVNVTYLSPFSLRLSWLVILFQLRTISIKINTTKQEYSFGSDQKIRDESPEAVSILNLSLSVLLEYFSLYIQVHNCHVVTYDADKGKGPLY